MVRMVLRMNRQCSAPVSLNHGTLRRRGQRRITSLLALSLRARSKKHVMRRSGDGTNALRGGAGVCEPRSGAGGIVGQEQVARAVPDGYTFVVSSLGSFIISPLFTPFAALSHAPLNS